MRLGLDVDAAARIAQHSRQKYQRRRCHDAAKLVGFGIMKYREEEGHLLLFAVRDSHRRRGIGSALMSWFERTALVAGIGVIVLGGGRAALIVKQIRTEQP